MVGKRSTLYVGGLSETIKAKDLAKLFEAYGDIVRCDIPYHKERHSGYAFVEFIDERDALDAYEGLRDVKLGGKEILLQWAKKSPSQGWSDGKGSPTRRRRSRSPPPRGRGGYPYRSDSRSPSFSPPGRRISPHRRHRRSPSRSISPPPRYHHHHNHHHHRGSRPQQDRRRTGGRSHHRSRGHSRSRSPIHKRPRSPSPNDRSSYKRIKSSRSPTRDYIPGEHHDDRGVNPSPIYPPPISPNN